MFRKNLIIHQLKHIELVSKVSKHSVDIHIIEIQRDRYSVSYTLYKGADTMDIAALSTGLSQMKIVQEASISIMKMAMDTAKVQAIDLTQILEANTKIMEQSINPHIGGNIDIRL